MFFSIIFSCALRWHKLGVSLLQQNRNHKDMKNTDFNINVLGNVISSGDSLMDILEMINDMDLELTGISLA